MKSVLISIQPKWVEKIVKGEKTIEVRKTAPKETPFKAYIYCTKAKKQNDIIWADVFGDSGKWNGHIIGEFVCDKVEKLEEHIEEGGRYYTLNGDFNEEAQLDNWQLRDYGKGKPLYGWHISDLQIYDRPRELSEFKTGCKGCNERDTYHCKFYCYGERPITHPPQSWQYVEELTNEQIYNTVIFN